MAQRSVPAPFLTKTYQLVEDGESDDVVSWSENGTTFVVWKTAEFAKDVLPNYFKHNNFSSFVRQLNTYGFRKIVPDKWEFANEYFKKGQKQLLTEIRRRKTVHASPADALKTHGGGASSPSNSGEDLGSTSTSSPETRSPRSAGAAAGPVFDLSGENEKLKRHNEILSSELAQTKKQCEELVAFLTEQVKVGPDQIDRILRQGTCGSSRTGSEPEATFPTDDDDNEEEESGEEQRLKLFGVWLNGKKNRKKRGREENIRCGGPHPKEMKAWVMMKMATPPPAETSKVCN